MKNRTRSTTFRAACLTLVISILWLDVAWALDPRQKLLDDAEHFLQMQSEGARVSSPEPLNQSFSDQNGSVVEAQSALQTLESQNLAPALTLKTSAGDLLQMVDGQVSGVTRADGTMLAGIRLDAEGRIVDADLRLPDGALQLVRDGGVIASRLPDGTDVYYGANGRVERTVAPDGREAVFAYTLNDAGTVLKTTVTSIEAVSEYDAEGRILQSVFASGKKIFYASGVLERAEENGRVHRYEISVQDDAARSTLRSIDDVDGNRYQLDDSGVVTSVVWPDGTRVEGIRWEAGTIKDARATTTFGTFDYQGGRLVRAVDAFGVESIFQYTADRIIVSTPSGGMMTECDLNGTALRSTFLDGSVQEYHTSGSYQGYAARRISPSGVVTQYDHSLVLGQVASFAKETVPTLLQTVKYASAAAISYTTNPRLAFSFGFTANDPDSVVRAQAANTATANIALTLVPGSGSTVRFGTGAAVNLGINLSASRLYTGEIRWETAGVGIYVYEKGTARPAAPQARIASKNWNPKFSLDAVNVTEALYTPSSGTYAKIFTTAEKAGAALTGNPFQKTVFKFDSTNTSNKIVLTASQPAVGLIQNTYTFTWTSGRWTLVKASYNSSTKKTTNTTTTFSQAMTVGREYTAELRVEGGKINLYSHETALARPATPQMSSAVLISTAVITASLTNATVRAEAFRNTGAVNSQALKAPSRVSDAAGRAALLSAASSAGTVERPEVSAVEYLNGHLSRVTQKDGASIEFKDGMLQSAAGATFGFEESAYGHLSSLTVEKSGLKTSYDAKGRLQSLTSGDQTVFYQNDRVTKIEKADGTRIEEIVFEEGSAGAIRDAVVRLPDGAVRRYAAGAITEERKADGSVTRFADGRPAQSRMADGRVYDYVLSGAGYEMTLKEYRTDAGDRVELDAVTGIPVRITRANGDVVEELGFAADGTLKDYALTTRDAQGSEWVLDFADAKPVCARNASGEEAYFEAGRLVRVVSPQRLEITLTYELDASEKILETRVTQGTEKRVFDASGRIIRYESEGIVTEYDPRGIVSILDGDVVYLRPVFDAAGAMVSGQIRLMDGTLYTISGARLVRTRRPDGVEISFDASALVSGIQEGSKTTLFSYTRGADGAVQDVKALLCGVQQVSLPDFLKSGTNPGYWPVAGLGDWHRLNQYNPEAFMKMSDGTTERVYNRRPASDTVSNYYLASSDLTNPADRVRTYINLDNYRSITVRKGGFLFVKVRVQNAPSLSALKITPTFGGTPSVLWNFAKEMHVSDGVATVLMPVAEDTTLPVAGFFIDFIPPQKASDSWTLGVEQAGYFELETSQSKAHLEHLDLSSEAQARLVSEATSAHVPSAASGANRALAFNRFRAAGEAPVRMTVGISGEAVTSVLADGATTAYASGRAARVVAPDGSVTEYEYDPDGQVGRMTTRPAQGPVTVTRYAYGKIREVTSEDGSPIYRYTYEFEGDHEFTIITDARTGEVKRYGEGRLLSSVDSQGLVTTYAYASGSGKDGSSRVASSTVSWKGQTLSRFTYAYEGDRTLITDEAGLTKIYDGTGKLIFVETADGLRYRKSDLTDESGSAVEEHALYSARTSDGVTLFYKNDTVEKIVLKDGTVLNVAEDQGVYRNVLLKEGLVGTVTHEDGSTATYLRDELGRLTFVDVARLGKVFRYDAQGDLVRITEPSSARTLDFGYRRDTQGRVTHTRVVERTLTPVGTLDLPVILRAASYGMMDGWNSSIAVDGVDQSEFNLNVYAEDGSYRGRGWSIARVNASGQVVARGFFDVYQGGSAEADRMAAFLEAIPSGDAVILAVADEGSKNLNERAIRAIETLGSSKIRGLGYRDSFALVGQKGAPAGSAIEELKKIGDDAAFASNAKTRIFYYDAAGKPIAYDDFVQSPSVSWNAYHSFEDEPELEVFASNAGGAAGWRKNFNPSKPDSGFVYLWDGINTGSYSNYNNNAQNRADYVALTAHVPAAGRYVYYDARYPSSLSAAFPEQMKAYLVSLGYHVVDASELKDFFQTHGPDTALVMLQSVMPDTVYDPLSPYSIAQRNIPREYMEKGGTIVWTHDLPFYYVGRADGSKTTIGEKGVRRMLGVIPTTRSVSLQRIAREQSFDWGTDGYRFLGPGVTYTPGAVRFEVPSEPPMTGQAAPIRVESLDPELPVSNLVFANVFRTAEVRLDANSSLSVGFTGTGLLNGAAASLSVRFEENGTVRALVQEPGGGTTSSAVNFMHEPGVDYTVELHEKGDWSEVYIYRTGEVRPLAITAMISHARWSNGTFFAEAHKGTAQLLATRSLAVVYAQTSATATASPARPAPVDQPVLDESVLHYDANVNFRQINWSAVKSQLGDILKSSTPIVSSYDASGRLMSVARADRTVLTYLSGSDRLDAVYDLSGNLLTDYSYDAAGDLIQIKNEGQRRALNEALFDAKHQVSLQKSYALEDQAIQAGLITQDFLGQVNTQRAQFDTQRSQVQNSMSELEGQKMKGSDAKKAKSQALDQLRDALRQIDQARSAFEEDVARQLALLSDTLSEKKLQIERDFTTAFTRLESEFMKSLDAVVLEEEKAVVIDVYRTVLGRDPTIAEALSGTTQTPAALKSTLLASPDRASRAARRDSILSGVKTRLDLLLNAADPAARQTLLNDLGLQLTETVTLSAQETENLKAFLDSQSLHFAESAIDPLIELLKSQGVMITESDRSQLAVRLILIDILTGQLHPFLKSGEEMLISLYALEKTSKLYSKSSSSFALSFKDLEDFMTQNPSLHPVVHVEGKHYVNVVGVTSSEVTILDGGEVKKLSKEDFQKVWKGIALLPDAHAPPAAFDKKLSVLESKETKGAFFFLIPAIIGAIGGIVGAVGGIIASISGILAGIGTLIGNIVTGLGSILGGVLNGISTLTQGLFTGLKFAGTHLFGGGLTGLFAPATQGGFFGLSLNSLTATSLFKSAVSIGLNYSLQKGLDALGVSPGISSVLTGFVTGGYLGGISPTGFDSSLALQAGLKGAVQAGSRTLLSASGLNSTVGDILSILSTAPATGGSRQGTIGGQSITINPTVVQSLASYGIQKLGQSIGLDPRISGLLGSVASGLVASVSQGQGILAGVNAGLVGGAVNLGISVALNQLNVPKSVRGVIEQLLNTENPNKPGTTYGQTLIGALSDGISMFTQGVFRVVQNTVSLASRILGKTADAAASVFKGAIRQVSQIFDPRSQESLLNEDQGSLLARYTQEGQSFRYDNGQMIVEYDAQTDTLTQHTANSTLVMRSPGFGTNGEVAYREITRFELFSDGTILEETFVSGGLTKAVYYYQSSPILRLEYDEAVTSTEGLYSSSGSIRYEAPVNIEIPSGTATREAPIPFYFDLSFTGGSVTKADIELVSATVNDDPNKDLYVLVNGVMNGKAKAEGAPDYLYNLRGDMVKNSQGAVGQDDVIPVGTYFTSGLLKLWNTFSNATDIGAALAGSGVMSAIAVALKKIVVDAIPSGIKLGQDLGALLVESSDPDKAAWLVQEIRETVEKFFDTKGKSHKDRPTVAMGYSGGFIPLVESLVRTPLDQTHSEYNVKTLVALGAATINVGAAVKDFLVKLVEAGDILYHKKWTDIVTVDNILRGLRMNMIELGIQTKDFIFDDVLGFLSQGLNKEAYDAYESKVKTLTNIVDQSFKNPALVSLTTSKATTILNVWGSEDMLSTIKINGTAIGGYRDNVGGFTQNDRNHTLINIEIMGAEHNDYMYEDESNPLTALWTAFTDPKQRDWKRTVGDFVSRLMINAQDADSVRAFMTREFDAKRARFDEATKRWIVTLPGWESRL